MAAQKFVYRAPPPQPHIKETGTTPFQMIVIADRMVVLDDGKQVWIAEGLSMEELKEGTQVKVVYEERDGKLVATSVEIVK
jgi:hypothetical protein